MVTKVRALLANTVVFVVAVGSARVGKQGDDGAAAHAIAILRAIHSAQQTFASLCAAGRYAASLSGLVTAPKGSSTGFLCRIYMRRDGRPIGPGLDGAELLR